jgi:hypothetical protein
MPPRAGANGRTNPFGQHFALEIADMKRTSCALALAVAGALLILQPAGTTLAQESIRQIELTTKQVEGFIAAQKDLAELAKKMEGTKAEQPDPKAQAEVEAIAKKHGFKNFADYDDVGSNIDMILAGIDADTKKFVPPQESLKKEIESVSADKSLAAADKAKLLEELNDSLKTAPAIQYPSNVTLIERYFDKLAAVLQQ